MDQRRDKQPQESILTARPLPTGWLDDLVSFMMPVGFVVIIVGATLLTAFIVFPQLYVYTFVFLVTAMCR